MTTDREPRDSFSEEISSGEEPPEATHAERISRLERRVSVSMALAVVALVAGVAAGFAGASVFAKPGPVGPVGVQGDQGPVGPRSADLSGAYVLVDSDTECPDGTTMSVFYSVPKADGGSNFQACHIR